MAGNQGICSAGATNELIAKATSGDRAAIEELLIAHSTRLSRHIARQLPPALQSTVSVDDIQQLTFVEVFRSITEFSPRSKRSFVAWLKTIADSRLQDARKGLARKKREGPHRQAVGLTAGGSSSVADLVDLLPGSGRTPSGSAARHEAIQAVQVGIAGLSEDQRDAVRLQLLEGKSLQETATAMDRAAWWPRSNGIKTSCFRVSVSPRGFRLDAAMRALY